jgi:HK97 family phage prohead protease/HK97 family phage major capsid protein
MDGLIYKAVAASGDGLEFVLSDETVDRYGDVIEAAGWVLNNFRKNPIALFGHSSAFPIGTWENVRVEGGKLIARLKLAARGTSARIDELISLVEQGILRAVSVGFRPLESEPIDKDRPYGGQRYTKQELLETSLVSVPANPAALQLAKSLHISDETMSLAFGEHADVRRRDITATGKHATKSSRIERTGAMMTLAQRIEHAQTELVAKRDKLTELTNAAELDNDAIAELTDQIDGSEKTIATLKAAEAKIGATAGAEGGRAALPAQVRKPLGHQEKDGMDLIVRAFVTHLVAKAEGISVDRALEQRYPGHEAVGVIVKADQTLGTTSVSGWASELVQTGYYGFLQALIGRSVYPELANRGLSLMFDQYGTISLPRRTAGTAGGGFVAEGSPIRVGKITTAAATLTPKKMGVIVPFSEELAMRSTPSIEAIVRQAIIEDTVATLDPILLDATASSTARPAGLLYGVSAA